MLGKRFNIRVEEHQCEDGGVIKNSTAVYLLVDIIISGGQQKDLCDPICFMA